MRNWIFLFLIAILPRFAEAQIQSQETEDWWTGRVFYEIVLRSYQDSDGDGIGDLRGLTSRLDYLAHDLGVQGIWISPFFESPSYHGFDVIDFKKVKPEYGTIKDFQELVHQAHARNLKILIDIPLNHTSSKHPWFQQALRGDPDAQNKYLFSDNDLKWPLPWNKKSASCWRPAGELFYYALFHCEMPDLNWQNTQVRKSVEDVFEFWSELGVDGFRLDAIRYLIEKPDGDADSSLTHQAIRTLVRNVKSKFPKVVFAGEVWDSAETIGSYSKDFDVAFDFPVASGIVTSIQEESAGNFLKALRETAKTYPSPSFSAPFFGNHDMDRAGSIFAGDTRKLNLALTAVLTLPGTPFLYYGEEIGLSNSPKPENPELENAERRGPMLWDSNPSHGFTSGKSWIPFARGVPVTIQRDNKSSTWWHTRRLLDLRRKNGSPLSHGLIKEVATGLDDVACFLRATQQESALVVLNFSGQASSEFVVDLGAGKSYTVGSLAPFDSKVIFLPSH